MTAPVGHAALLARLAAERQGGNWPSAYIFAGPAGVGKRRVAGWHLQAFACTGAEPRPCGTCVACRQLTGGNYPDYHVLGVRELVNIPAPSDDEAREEITIRRIDALRGELSRRPYYAAGHLVIIDEAERLNPHSANALLKTLEEPHGRPVIILVTARFHRLLATIRSRCRTVRFGRLAPAESEQVVREQGFAYTQLDAALAAGSAGRLAALTAGGHAGARQALARHLATGEPGWWEMAKLFGLDKKGAEASLARQGARAALELLLSWQRWALRRKYGVALPAELAEYGDALAEAAEAPAAVLAARAEAALAWLPRLELYANAAA
ncbi:MAG: hypothetical protein A2107_05780, partial [Verrucomicrobia bacterium GWF2_62_7]